MKPVKKISLVPWSTINSFGKMKFSKSSYFYLVLIPILVKLTNRLEDPLFVSFGENDYLLTLSLPFSWYMFYFGAISIAFGSILYQIFCPSLIKKFSNYGEFLEAGESDFYLENEAKKYAVPNKNIFSSYFKEKPYVEEAKIEERRDEETADFFINSGVEPPFKKYSVTSFKQNIKYDIERRDVFNRIYKKVELHNKPIRIIAYLLYMLGFLLFFYVVFENIIFVIKKLIW